jgi:hypothetical protein
LARSTIVASLLVAAVALSSAVQAGVLLTAQKVDFLNPLSGFTAWELSLETDDDSLLQAFDATLSGSFHQTWFDKDFDSIVDVTGRGSVDGRVDSHLVLPGNALIVRDPTEDNNLGTGTFLSGVWGVPGASQASSTSLAYLVLPTDAWDLSVDLKIATSAGLVEFTPDMLLSTPDPRNSGKQLLASAAVIPPPPVPPPLPEVVNPPVEEPNLPPLQTELPVEEPNLPPLQTELPIELPVDVFPPAIDLPWEDPSIWIPDLPTVVEIVIPSDPAEDHATEVPMEAPIEIPIDPPTLTPVSIPYIIVWNGELQWFAIDPAFTGEGTIAVIDAVAFDAGVTLAGLKTTGLRGAMAFTQGMTFHGMNSDGAAFTRSTMSASEVAVPEPHSLVVSVLFLISSTALAQRRRSTRV